MGITVKLGWYLHLLHYSREELVGRTGFSQNISKRFGPTAFQKKPTIWLQVVHPAHWPQFPNGGWVWSSAQYPSGTWWGTGCHEDQDIPDQERHPAGKGKGVEHPMAMQTQGLCPVWLSQGCTVQGARLPQTVQQGVVIASECTAWLMLPCEEAETKSPCDCTQQLLYSAKPPMSKPPMGRDLLLQTWEGLGVLFASFWLLNYDPDSDLVRSHKLLNFSRLSYAFEAFFYFTDVKAAANV